LYILTDALAILSPWKPLDVAQANAVTGPTAVCVAALHAFTLTALEVKQVLSPVAVAVAVSTLLTTRPDTGKFALPPEAIEIGEPIAVEPLNNCTVAVVIVLYVDFVQDTLMTVVVGVTAVVLITGGLVQNAFKPVPVILIFEGVNAGCDVITSVKLFI